MPKKNRIYVDVHVLQTLPPSCVNRDDTGSPKTAVYGGVRRARVSSQSWKHAMRLAFMEMYESENLGIRTKNIVGLITSKIEQQAPDANAAKLAKDVLTAAGLTINEKNPAKGTDALFFMSDAQATALAKIAVETTGTLNKDACKKALKETPSVDQALFGRMVASDPSLNYDAAAQVAHAISTHGVQNEFDYFTAVDDLNPEESSGAAHLGTVEFNSSTMYRYATVNVSELAQSLESDAPLAVRNFIEAFICSMPTGKQNTFANRTLPDDVYVTIRLDQPINLVGAFENPVPSSGGYLSGSETNLTAYAQKLYATFAKAPEKAYGVGEAMSAIAMTMSFNDLLDKVEKDIADELGKGEA